MIFKFSCDILGQPNTITMKSIFIFLFVSCSVVILSAQVPDFELEWNPDQPNTMRSYLVESASEITHSFLDDVHDLDTWKSQRDVRREELIEMLGLVDVPIHETRTAPNMVKTGTLQMDGYRIEKLYYESLPGLYVPANLYIPDQLNGPTPTILYLCGHAREMMAAEKYQGNARKFAQLGFVCLIIETIQFGEVEGEHWGTYARGWFHWLSRGYHPGGVEVWNEIRAIDLLESMDFVDPEQIGVTGPSGGGSQSWYIAAIDERVACVAPVAGGETIEAEVLQKTVDEHCDCMMPHNIYQRDFTDIGALIAPRPLLTAAPSRDGMFAIEAVREMHNDIVRVYDWYGKSDVVEMIEAVGGHGTREVLRPKIYAFFLRHLMGKVATPEEIGDIDFSQTLPVDDLKVYVDGPPADNRTTTIQESFITLAKPPPLKSAREVADYKSEVNRFLKEKTFHHFPLEPVPLDARMEYRALDGAPYGKNVFSFVTEKGWRLEMEIVWRRPQDEKQPILLVLRNPGEERWGSESFLSGIDRNITVAYFAARGIGETGWSPNQQWDIRRTAGWTGRTIASMRVYDVLRSLEFLKSLPAIDAEDINLAARGEMAAVALYTGLLDGHLKSLVIQDPPATQNQPSSEDGTGEAIEMLSCLQVTDLPQVAGILSPTKVYSIGDLPSTYDWAKDLHRKVLGKDDFVALSGFSEWQY